MNLCTYLLKYKIMERSVRNWRKVTKAVYGSVLLATISGMVAVVLSGISYWHHGGDLSVLGSLGTNLFTITLWIAHLMFIAGTFLYFMNIGSMRALVSGKDTIALGHIRVGLALVLLASVIVLFHIPQWRGSVWIAVILNIAAYVVIIVGFATLKKSEIMSVKARLGFKNIFIAMILCTLGAILFMLFSWIPYAGVVFSVIACTLIVVGCVMIISGWNSVRNALPPVK